MSGGVSARGGRTVGRPGTSPKPAIGGAGSCAAAGTKHAPARTRAKPPARTRDTAPRPPFIGIMGFQGRGRNKGTEAPASVPFGLDAAPDATLGRQSLVLPFELSAATPDSKKGLNISSQLCSAQ